VAQIHGLRGNENDGEDDVPDRLWRAVPVDSEFRPYELERYRAEAVMLDSPSAGFGGSGRTFDWDRIRDVSVRIIVAGGLDGENVETAIRVLRPWGVDACSRLEQTPGRKDPEKIRRFVEAARVAFASLERTPAA
jgi:phosphoribosylanthranilate isomerase